MAIGDGVRWFLRLVLDDQSKEEVQREAQEALNKGTDPKQAKENVGQVQGAFAKLKKAAVALGAVLASLWVVRRVTQYAKAVFDLGAQVAAVESQFRTVFGEALADNLARGNEELRKLAGLTRTEMREILAAAGSMGQGMGMAADQSARFAEQVLELSADLASFSGGAYSTAEAARLVQSALIGNTEAARSLLVNFTAMDVQQRAMEQTGKTSADALTQQEKALAGLSVIMERAGPQMGDLARTQDEVDNRAKQLGGSWNTLKETLSDLLVSGSGVGQIFGDLTDVLIRLDEWVTANADSIQKWARVGISSTVAVGRTFGNLANIVYQSVTFVSTSLATLLLGATGVITEVIDRVAQAVNWIIDQANRLPKVNIDFRINRNLDPDQFFEAAGRGVDTLQNKLESIDGSTRGLADAWRDVAESAAAAEEAQDAALTTPSLGAGDEGTEGGEGAGDGELPPRRQRVLLEPELAGTEQLDLSDQFREAVGLELTDELQEEFERLTRIARNESANIESAMSGALWDVQRSFQSGFALLADDMSNLGGLAEEVFRGLAAAGVESLGKIASSKAAENIALAFENRGKATAKFAQAFTYPPAAAAGAAYMEAARENVVAAAKWAVLAGGAAAAGAAIGGGGGRSGGGRSSSGQDLSSEVGEPENEQKAPHITLVIDGVDPNNPRHQELVGSASREYEERFGGKITQKRYRRRRRS